MTQAVELIASAPARRWSFLWVGLGAAIALVVGLSSLFLTLTSMQNDLLARDRERRMETIGQNVTTSIDEAGRFAVAEAETISANGAIAKALGEQDRARLFELTRGLYQKLNAHGVAVLGFQTPDLRYFLRVHQPDLFGDDLSKTRAILLAVNKTRQSQSGVESGNSGAFVRGAAPVMNDDQLVGTVEVGVNLEVVIAQVKADTNADVAVIFSQSLSGLAAKDPNESFGDLSLATSTNSPLFASLLRERAISLSRDSSLSARQIEGVDSAILVQPLIDFSGRMIGVVAAVKGFSRHNIERRQTEVDMLADAFIVGIFAFAVFSALARLLSARDEAA